MTALKTFVQIVRGNIKVIHTNGGIKVTGRHARGYYTRVVVKPSLE